MFYLCDFEFYRRPILLQQIYQTSDRQNGGEQVNNGGRYRRSLRPTRTFGLPRNGLVILYNRRTEFYLRVHPPLLFLDNNSTKDTKACDSLPGTIERNEKQHESTDEKKNANAQIRREKRRSSSRYDAFRVRIKAAEESADSEREGCQRDEKEKEKSR